MGKSNTPEFGQSGDVKIRDLRDWHEVRLTCSVCGRDASLCKSQLSKRFDHATLLRAALSKAKCSKCSAILNGISFAEIAEADKTSRRRIQDVADIAMLAPDIWDTISPGEQPGELKSAYLIKTGLPAIWKEERSEYAKL